MADIPSGWTLHRHGTVASTNEIAKELAEQDADEGAVIVAEEQQAGKGRSGRTWTSPPGNLYCSVIIRPGDDCRTVSDLSFVVAVAMRAAIAGVVQPTKISLKWPNDILINGFKASGILLEGGADFVVAGTGVNVATVPKGADQAAALQQFNAGASVDDVLFAYTSHLAERLAVWRSDGLEPIRSEWLEHCIGLGQPIIARTGRATEQGVFEGLDKTGALVLRRDDGEISIIHAGDVFFAEGRA